MFYSTEDLTKWNGYIEEKIRKSNMDFPKNLKDLLLNSETINLDYAEFEDEDQGEFGVFYMDLKNGENTTYIRITEYLDHDYRYWGLPEQEKTFNDYLEENFDLNSEQIDYILETIRDFFDTL